MCVVTKHFNYISHLTIPINIEKPRLTLNYCKT